VAMVKLRKIRVKGVLEIIVFIFYFLNA